MLRPAFLFIDTKNFATWPIKKYDEVVSRSRHSHNHEPCCLMLWIRVGLEHTFHIHDLKLQWLGPRLSSSKSNHRYIHRYMLVWPLKWRRYEWMSCSAVLISLECSQAHWHVLSCYCGRNWMFFPPVDSKLVKELAICRFQPEIPTIFSPIVPAFCRQQLPCKSTMICSRVLLQRYVPTHLCPVFLLSVSLFTKYRHTPCHIPVYWNPTLSWSAALLSFSWNETNTYTIDMCALPFRALSLSQSKHWVCCHGLRLSCLMGNRTSPSVRCDYPSCASAVYSHWCISTVRSNTIQP
jgi:hypothetical protein